MAEVSITKSLAYNVNPNAVTFDGEPLNNAEVMAEYARHETPAERIISTLPIARRDGSVFVMQRYGEKTVSVKGVIIGEDAADLEAKIDALKEILSREQKELAIFSAGIKRVYVATAKEPIFEREHFHVLYIPFTVDFVVPSGEGQDADDTDALLNEALETDTPVDTSFTLEGTKAGRPVISIEGNNWPSGCLGIELENTDTGEKITITDSAAWGNDSVIEIDCDEKEVNHIISGVPALVDFYGTIPLFKIGENNMTLKVGKILSKGTTEPDIASVGSISAMGTATYYSHSFLNPYTNATFRKMRLPFRKFGSPTGNIIVEIRADDGTGKPSGSYVVQMSMAISGLTTSEAYYELTAAAAFTLQANTTYWVVVYGDSVDNSNGFYWGDINVAHAIPGGITRVSTNSGSSWNSPIARYQAFELYWGGLDGTSDVLFSVNYRKTYL